MNDLAQFNGATVVRVQHQNVDDRTETIHLEMRLPDGSTRDLTFYAISPGYDDPQGVCVRIDGMYVPPEEL